MLLDILSGYGKARKMRMVVSGMLSLVGEEG